MTIDEAIASFLAHRPYYDPDHVQHIAEYKTYILGVPFCTVCFDWHTSDEEHSEES